MNNKTSSLTKQKYLKRDSGIELLKIIAIVLIVINHVTQTIMNENQLIVNSLPLLDLYYTTNNVQQLILSAFRTLGMIGNAIFFACSAWFLVGSSKSDKRKVFNMIVEVWVISIISLIITAAIRKGSISIGELIKAIFPTTLSVNWYITYYILFYLIHPFLNKAIYSMTKKQLFRFAALLFFIYSVIHFVKDDILFSPPQIYLAIIYFWIAYIKLYCKDFSKNIKLNTIVLLIGLFGQFAGMLLTNIVGNRFNILHRGFIFWIQNVSPFVILIAVSAFLLAKEWHFKSVFINYISSLSLLVYIIHENFFVRRYLRPEIMLRVYNKFGYDRIVLWVIIIAIAIFVVSVILSSIYKAAVKPIIDKIADKLFVSLRKLYLTIEKRIVK